MIDDDMVRRMMMYVPIHCTIVIIWGICHCYQLLLFLSDRERLKGRETTTRGHTQLAPPPFLLRKGLFSWSP